MTKKNNSNLKINEKECSSEDCSEDEDQESSSSGEEELLRLGAMNLSRQNAGARKNPIKVKSDVEMKTDALKAGSKRFQNNLTSSKKLQLKYNSTLEGIHAASNSNYEVESQEEPSLSWIKLYKLGKKHIQDKNISEALVSWEKALDVADLKEIAASSSTALFGDLRMRLGIGYVEEGSIRKGINQFLQIEKEAQEFKYPLPLLAFASSQLSLAFRSIGEMDDALYYQNQANHLLGNLVPKNGNSNKLNKEFSELMLLAKEGDFTRIRECLANPEHGKSLSQYEDPELAVTFLMQASGRGEVDIVCQLLEYGANLETQDCNGQTCLAWASRFGQCEVIQILLQKGAQFTNIKSHDLKSWPVESLNTFQLHLATLKATKMGTKTDATKPPLSKTRSKQLNASHSNALAKETGNVPVKEVKQPQDNEDDPNSCNESNTLPPISSNFNAAPKSHKAQRGDLVGRNLVKWNSENTFDSEECLLEDDLQKDDEDAKSDENWDQFTANQRLFGVKNTYCEEIYTTPLQRNKISKEMKEKAERLANEISNLKSSNAHVAEERGQMDVNEDDEEAKYGAVLGSGAYAVCNTRPTDAEKNDTFTDSGIFLKEKSQEG